MAKNENIAKELKTRLSELTGRLAEIDSELRKSGQLTSKIKMRSKASRVLKFRKSIRFRGR
jgi:hypothetical protein